ncbi:MAG TPA: hypothetical protein VGG61_10080 [Gemmataceae bacterium]
MAHRHTRNATLGILVGTALVSGCGLAEYEANMASEQARIHRIDLENKYLEDPIEWPAKKESDKKDGDKKDGDKKDVDKNWADVFFRPPRGIDRKPQQQQRGMLYEYRRSKDNNGPILEILIGTGVDQKDFSNDVRKLFPPSVSAITTRRETRTVPGRNEPLAFELTTFDDANSTYLKCIYKKGDAQVAVVYHLEKTGKLVVFSDDEKSESELANKIRLSLESLGVDQEASRLRVAFNKYHQKARSR